MLNVFVLTARLAMKVYMFHDRQFCLSVTSPFFCPHDLYEDISMDAVQPPFYPLMYLADEESDSDTCLTPTYSIKSDPSKLTYPSKPTYPSVIHSTLDSSPSTESQVQGLRCGCSFIHTLAIPQGHRQAHRGGHGNAPKGFRNHFVPF